MYPLPAARAGAQHWTAGAMQPKASLVLQPSSVLQKHSSHPAAPPARANPLAATRASVPPVIQAVIGQIPPEDKALKARRGRKFSDIQAKCNELRELMDNSEAILAGALASAEEVLLFMDVEAINQAIRQLLLNLDSARALSNSIHPLRRPPGYGDDNGVQQTISYYSTKWISLIRKGILQLEDSTTSFADSFTKDSPEDLDSHKPLLFRRLVRKGLLTVNPSVRPYPTGKAYNFRETGDWALHVHPYNLSGARAHYKPKEDEGGLGYHGTNPVHDLTLLRLGVLDQ